MGLDTYYRSDLNGLDFLFRRFLGRRALSQANPFTQVRVRIAPAKRPRAHRPGGDKALAPWATPKHPFTLA
jgi:hypothetical protein